MSQEYGNLEARFNAQDEVLREHTRVLAKLEESVMLLRKDLLGNGQPGKLDKFEDRITTLEHRQEHAKGYIAGIATFGSLVGGGVVYALQRMLHIKP